MAAGRSLTALAFALLLAAVLALSACGGTSSSTVSDEARRAVDAFGQLDSSLGVGINYLDYMRELRDAAAALDNLSATMESSADVAVAWELSQALEFYRLAGKAWDSKNEGNRLPSSLLDRAKWQEMGLNHPGKSPDHSDLMQECWRVAGEHVSAARGEL
jgi:hypothetical protein